MTSKIWRPVCLALALTGGRLVRPAQAAAAVPAVAQWDLFEVALPGPAAGNPYVEVQLTAAFTHGARTVAATGFYDGDGVYRIRFMPDETGAWHYETASNCPDLDRRSGAFTVTPAGPGNHGPVRVHDTYHFAYADGTPFHELGTTCYTWIHRPEALQEQTLRTLAASPFNKLRMCVFPQDHSLAEMPPPSSRLPAPRRGTGTSPASTPRFSGTSSCASASCAISASNAT